MEIASNITLKISFEFYKGNEVVFDLIKKLADENNINGYLERVDNKVSIVVSSSMENIQNFADKLGKLLPLSLFISDASTEAVDDIGEIGKGFKIKGEINVIPQNLSICPNCLKELFDPSDRRFYFPFISCNYCGNQYSYLYDYPFTRENTLFKFFQMCENCKNEYNDKRSFRYKYPLIACYECLTPIYLKKGENERYGFNSEKTVGAVETATGVIKKGNLLKVYTGAGLKLVGLINEENIKKVRDYLNINELITVLFTDFTALNEYFILTENEIKALASQEKPIVYVRPSEKFKERELVSNDLDIVKLKLPDDPLMLLLAYHLKREGIKYIFITELDENKWDITDFELNADLPVVNSQRDLEMIVIDKHYILGEGERGVLPNILKAKATGNLSIGYGYGVLDLGGEYLIDRKERILHQLKDFVEELNEIKILEGEEEPTIDVKYQKITTYPAWKGAVNSVLAERGLLEDKAIALYFSTNTNEDLIAIKTADLKPAIEIQPLPIFNSNIETIKYIFNTIENSSKTGEKLIKNFYQKFPHFEEKLSQINLGEAKSESKSFGKILELASYILEFTELDRDYSQFYTILNLTDKAIKFSGNKGVRIDFLIDEIEDRFYLNWEKIFRSLLSYRVAGAESDMLAFSLIDEFTNWLINQVATIHSKLKIENIVLAGNLFLNPLITPKLINSFSKHNLLINRALPIDRQNVPFGGIFA